MTSDSLYLTKSHSAYAQVITRNDTGTYTLEHMNESGYPDNSVTLTREQMLAAIKFVNEREQVSIIRRSVGGKL